MSQSPIYISLERRADEPSLLDSVSQVVAAAALVLLATATQGAVDAACRDVGGGDRVHVLAPHVATEASVDSVGQRELLGLAVVVQRDAGAHDLEYTPARPPREVCTAVSAETAVTLRRSF